MATESKLDIKRDELKIRIFEKIEENIKKDNPEVAYKFANLLTYIDSSY